MPKKPYFFVSYVRSDAQRVLPIVQLLNEAGIETWVDTKQLKAGVSWQEEINTAIREASGLIVFLSRESARSEWVIREITLAEGRGGFIIPVMLDPPDKFEVPIGLRNIQWVDFSAGVPSAKDIIRLVNSINYSIGRGTGLQPEEIQAFAEETRQQARRDHLKPLHETPKSVFIVHGHDFELRDEVDKYLLEVGVEPVVLSKMDNKHKSLFQKFLAWSEETRFAVVLLTSDDIGAGRFQYDVADVRDKALQYRARQNVILELGFFYGYLGWENVFVLYKKADKIFPNFERPSDLDGVLFEEVDDTGRWKNYLRERLVEAGFELK